MAIFMYALLGVGMIVLGGLSFGIGAEWWAGLILIGFGLLCLGISVYKLNDEYRFISDFFEKKKGARANKIWNAEYKTRPMNMVPMFVKAYDERKNVSRAYIMGKARSCILSGYKAILKNWMLVARETDKLDNVGDEERIRQILYEAIEAELVLLVCADEKIDDGDYDVYCNVCRALSGTPRTKADMRVYCQELMDNPKETVEKKIGFFYNVARRNVRPAKFEKLVQGFCYMALSDNTVHEDEYNVISLAFFREGLDTFPKTWEQFKREYT